MQTILSVGLDPAVLYTRGLVLATKGATVSSVTPEKALDLLKICACDLLILCHSIRDDNLLRLYSAARACAPATKILVVESRSSLCPSTLDVNLRFPRENGPHLLMQAVQSLLGNVEEQPPNTPPQTAQLFAFPSAKRPSAGVARPGQPPPFLQHSLRAANASKSAEQ